MHGDVVAKLLEGFGAGDEIGLAIDFDEHANLAAGVNVTADQTFAGFALGLFGGGSLALFAEDVDGLLDIAGGFNQRGAAIGKARVGTVAQLFYELWRKFPSAGLCAHCSFFSMLIGFRFDD